MKISKHIHSCLLIKDQGKVILIDPGSDSVANKAININDISQLDYLLITHEHPDHMNTPFIKGLVDKFPEVEIISNQSVVDILAKENIKAVTVGNESIQCEEVGHEEVIFSKAPQNYLFNIFNKLTDPGDSMQYKLTTPILVFPIQAPWGSVKETVTYAISQKPKIVIPIHDWHWKDEFRSDMYKRLKDYFAQNDIKFLGLETGEEIEL